MAEAFGVVAGALTVIELSAKTVSRCKHLIETAQDAPKDLRHILIEVSSLQSALESLKFLAEAENDFSQDLRSRKEMEGAINGCRDTMEELAAELSSLTMSEFAQAGPSKRQKLSRSMAWCLKESKARKLLEAATHHKSTITLALLSDVARDVKDVKQGIGSIQDTLSEVKLREICSWLERINPTYAQNESAKLRDEKTCRWILRQQEWQEWCSETQRRSIWIHGIPGAGKTVLASFINEQLENGFELEPERNFHIYFYFSYRHPENQSMAFLGWVLGQLCRHLNHVPQAIQLLHKRSVEPKPSDLLDAIKVLLPRLDLVHLVVDAVDECNDRTDLLVILSAFLNEPEFQKIRLLATSRDYIDIRAVFEPISTTISMSNFLVSEDILTYVKTEIQRNSKLSRWPSILKEEIIQSLVNGANGMFRWATCQLYVLQRKRSEIDIRKALKELPETLDETYLRTLREIPREDWSYARKALMWICVHQMLRFPTGIPNTCLISAILLDSPIPGFDYSMLHEICGCLVSTSNVQLELNEDARDFDATLLAHYTVKEFLFSDRLSASDLSYFSLKEQDAATEYLTTVLTKCHQLDLSVRPNEYWYESFSDYCREAARIAPFDQEELIVNNDTLWQLQLDLLNSPRWPVSNILQRYVVEDDDGAPVRLLCWHSIPTLITGQQALMLLSMMEDFLDRMMAKFLLYIDLEAVLSTPIVLNALNGDKIHTNFMEAIGVAGVYYGPYMAEKIVRAMRNRVLPTTALVLSMAGHEHGVFTTYDADELPHLEKTCRLHAHLGDGADPDGPAFRTTPLQIAALRWDCTGAAVLLKAGADPNKVGNARGRLSPNVDNSKYLWSPLHIVRNSEYCLDHVMWLLGEEDREAFVDARNADLDRFEKLLMEHGGRDFIASEQGHN